MKRSISEVTQIVLLGTGTPNAEPSRSGPSIAIVVNEFPYLVDFGPGVIRRASEAYQRNIQGLEPKKLCHAFLTHLHSDHTAGLPDLILTPWVLERESPLLIFGPPGVQSMADHILAAYREDIRERIDGLEPANLRGYQVIVEEIEAGKVYEDENVSVEAFHAHHGSWPAFGYRFTTPDRIIVVSGDTAPNPGMEVAYAGCDILLHEVYSVKGFQKLTAEWQRYHSAVHTSTKELAEVAQQVLPKQLVLYHQLLWGETEQSLVSEIIEDYPGIVISGQDLEVF